MNKMETFVVNPDTHKPVSVAEWAKEKNPKRAELLLLKTEGYSLLIAKNMFDGEYDFDEAQEKAAEGAGTGKVGRPTISDGDVKSDATGVSKDSGANTKEGRETASAKCPICHSHELHDGMKVCESCMEALMEEYGED